MIRLTGKDLDKIQINAEDLSTERVERLLKDIENAFDEDIEIWAKQFVVSTIVTATSLRLNPISAIYEMLLIGLYLGAKMQSLKEGGEMTVHLQFHPGPNTTQ